MKVLSVLKYPIVRHILAAAGICVIIYVFAVEPMQSEINALHQQIDKDRALIGELSKRDTYKIENRISDVRKLKDGSTINMIPTNDMKVENRLVGDTLRIPEMAKENSYRRHWWQFWREKR